MTTTTLTKIPAADIQRNDKIRIGDTDHLVTYTYRYADDRTDLELDYKTTMVLAKDAKVEKVTEVPAIDFGRGAVVTMSGRIAPYMRTHDSDAKWYFAKDYDDFKFMVDESVTDAKLSLLVSQGKATVLYQGVGK